MTHTTVMVIFGASGDLTSRKLVPAIFNLYRKGRLPDGFRIVGMARSDMNDASFRDAVRKGMLDHDPEDMDEEAWKTFSGHLTYVCGNFKDDSAIDDLKQRLSQLEQEIGGDDNRLYYLATPPQIYEPILDRLGETGMVEPSRGWRRVVIEKPFGHDLESAKQLNQATHRYLDEDQIFRIDHYLGKETVQNVLVFRFANSIFEPIWNRRYIDNVQITVAEEVGVGHRGNFYDGVGIMRDMFQNHLMQLLSLVAMEPPASFQGTAIRNERVKVLSSIRPISPDEVGRHSIRGQYWGYRDEPGVAKDSETATYAALRLCIDNWRWQGVPFYLRSGKSLAAKRTEIHIQFKTVPHLMFPMQPGETIRPNALGICIQPDEGMHLRFEAKVPDTQAKMRSVDMEFHYADAFGKGSIPEAYERLLLDAINGDSALFTRADTIELAWGLIDSILEGWSADKGPKLQKYEPGSWGPVAADDFLAADDRHWTLNCGKGQDRNGDQDSTSDD
jgi:glucose-6-phosphate 1-dehydrogenase